MERVEPILDEIANAKKEMVKTLISWANINSWTDNPQGLSEMASTLKEAFLPLGEMTELPLPAREVMNLAGEMVSMPTGKALLLTKRPEAKVQIFLGGHMDTVFPPSSSFQKAIKVDSDTLKGPGVADMKGGLLVMLKALETLEKSPHAKKLGWQVLINPDEEVGSVSSYPLIRQRAQKCHWGLVFEPSFDDGSLVSSRKGSANYSLEVSGKKSHAGRDFLAGRNAIVALAQAIIDIKGLSEEESAITVNVGRIVGGGPTNIVPDWAFCQFNVRTEHVEDMVTLHETLEQIVELGNEVQGITLKLHRDSLRPPKPFNDRTQELFEVMRSCGQDLNLDLKWRKSGGVCDGNILSEAGLPTIDTLGVIGGGLHTHDEYMKIDSLVERAQLTAHFLMQFAQEIPS